MLKVNFKFSFPDLITDHDFFDTVFGRAIHSLAKIGDELHIEPATDGLILKTVNSSRSAYAAFKFPIPFFINYSYISENTMQNDVQEEEVIKCKLPMKVLLCLSILTFL